MTAVQTSFAEVFSSALRGEPCHVVGAAGPLHALPVSTWRRSPDAADVAVLSRCVGPTLDIGCGPGRMTQYLAERGHLALGIDVVPEAVFQTRERGVAAMLRDVFEPVPGEGRWETALLADGNIGIGGDPRALLARVAALLAPGGRVVVDLEAPGAGLETRTIRLETPSRTCRPFPWSVVGADAIGLVAAGTGLVVDGLHHHGNRWFAVLTKGR
ncbi:MAG: class I SAM-dependent methyltransferase [Propionibacteriales bacterium]|nr:class I SAM-dependent methyltransferase [Propionibacteriales bacterium]